MQTCGWSTITLKGLSVHISINEKDFKNLSDVLMSLLVITCDLNFLLRSYGDPVHCRKALHRAVQCTSDYPEHVCEVLLTFERVEGESLHKIN